MSIKSILCVCNGVADDISCLNVSLRLAKSQSAQLRFLHITAPFNPYVEEFVTNSILSDIVESGNQEKLDRAQHFTSHYAALHHVPLNVPDGAKRHASAEFVHCMGAVDDVIMREGRVSDIVVIGRSKDAANILFDDSLVAALFDTGRPALVVPYVQGPQPREWEHKTVALLWNGSLESTHALANALPFLEEAERVYVITAHAHDEPSNISDASGVLRYLQAHDIIADVIMIDRRSLPTEEALLAKTRELCADLIVMGAYSHSRAREMFLGGVTHLMLANANVPLLLSH